MHFKATPSMRVHRSFMTFIVSRNTLLSFKKTYSMCNIAAFLKKATCIRVHRIYFTSFKVHVSLKLFFIKKNIIGLLCGMNSIP